MLSPTSSQSINRRHGDRRGVSPFLIAILAILAVSVWFNINNQIRLIQVDYDRKLTIDWANIAHNALPNTGKKKDVKYDNIDATEIDDDEFDDDYNDSQSQNNKGGWKESVDKKVDSPKINDAKDNPKDNEDEDDDEDDNMDPVDDHSVKSEIVTDFVEAKVAVRPTDGQRMNVLILYPDDWRHDSLGSENPYVLTPFLDQLANEGIRFTHNAVTTSVCWMSRATLWMGQYSSRHRSYRLKCPRFSTPANWDHSWVRMLQKVGYFVGHIGKWQYYSKDVQANFDWTRLFEGHHWETIYGGRRVHASDLAKERAFEFLEERPKDKPFVLSIAFYPPKPVGDGRAPGHQWSPTNETRKLYDNVTIPEPETKESYQKLPQFLQKGVAVGRFGQRYPTSEHFQASMKNYYALVTGVDQACKEIVDKLKEEGLYNNTMIIFTTDNGMFHGAHGLAGKWYPYQESIRVPLIIYDPRMPSDKVGTLDDSFTLNVDLAKTILGAAGVKPDDLMQGRDISDLYLPNEKDEYHNTPSVKNEAWRDEFFYEFPSPEALFIPASTALVRKDWKFIHWSAHDREQFFNLKDDPLELDDLYNTKDAEIKAVLDSMRERHNELKEELHDTSYVDDEEPCKRFLVDLSNS